MFFNRKTVKHKHEYQAIRCYPYSSLTGPRTVISVRCSCGKIDSVNKTGFWKLEDLENTVFRY